MSETLKRKFMYDDEELIDPGSMLTIEEVRKYHSQKIPELTNASFTQKIDSKEKVLVITFGKTLGTKGEFLLSDSRGVKV
jgi:PRTRC genetic system protein C